MTACFHGGASQCRRLLNIGVGLISACNTVSGGGSKPSCYFGVRDKGSSINEKEKEKIECPLAPFAAMSTVFRQGIPPEAVVPAVSADRTCAHLVFLDGVAAPVQG